MRKNEFAVGEYYHIYNRGVDKRDVFLSEKDYGRFIMGMTEFNNGMIREERQRIAEGLSESDSVPESDSDKRGNLVEIICYCLNPNHYHFILKQLRENGVSKFMQKLSTGYTNYFNKKYERSGVLFQGKYKSIYIDSNEYLLYLSAYVNMNHFIHGYTKSIKEALKNSWSYSSLSDYLGRRNGQLCNKEPILGQFDNNFSEYEKYLEDNALYFKEKKEIEKYILE